MRMSPPVLRRRVNRKRASLATGAALAVTILVSALALTPLAASAGDPGPHRSHGSQGPKPTVVLVHGAWADGSSWSDVARRLLNDGYPVRIPPNPLRNLTTDSDTLRSFVATIPGPVILVGHSYGGAVITNAGTGNANLKGLVYVDAFAPAEGETVFPLAGADSALAVDPTTVFDFVPYPGAPAGDVDLYLKPGVFFNEFATGVPRPEAELLYAAQRRLTFSAGNTASGVPAYETTPSWYVLGTEDRIITPEAQQAMATRAGAQITRVDAGHLSMITHPAVVAAVIEKAARSVG